ncbi:MAG: T9SS type A sorting domain-containing protein [Bacteroidota bacterium]
MRLLCLCACVLLAGPVSAQSFILEASSGGGGLEEDVARGLALSPEGDRYITGIFEDVATFGEASVTSIGGNDFFLVKYGPAGDVLWARRGGTNANDFAAEVAVAPDGGVYLVGSFNGSATFDGGANPDVLLISAGGFDIFLAKYDIDGTIQWVQQGGGAGQDVGRDLAVDDSGNAYVAGSFEGDGNFGGRMVTSAGESDALLVKYAPDGSVAWARRSGGGQDDAGYGVAVTPDGTAHVSGVFRSTAQFGPLSRQSLGGADVFVAQYDASGEVAWATRIGSPEDEVTRGGGIDLAANGTVYVHGGFDGTITIGSDVLTSLGMADVFVARINRSGDPAWARRGGGDGDDAPNALNVFGNGVLITGAVEGSGSFSEVPFTTQAQDAYFAVFDIAGNLFDLNILGGPGDDVGTAIDSDASRAQFSVAGLFEETAAFGSLELTSAGETDAYLVDGRFGVVDLEPDAGAPTRHALGAAYPNPFRHSATLALDVAAAQHVRVELFDVLGRRVSMVHAGRLPAGQHRVTVQAAGLPTGLYLVRAEGETFQLTRRVTLVR